jgi:hypothetical protein
LGLNRNFSLVVLHGPTLLGGIGIPSISQKQIQRLYFTFHLQPTVYIHCAG